MRTVILLLLLLLGSIVWALEVDYHIGTGLDTAANALAQHPQYTEALVEIYPDMPVDKSIAVYAACRPALSFQPQCARKTVWIRNSYRELGPRGMPFDYPLLVPAAIEVVFDAVRVTRRPTNWTSAEPCPIEPLWTRSSYGGPIVRCPRGGRCCVDPFGQGWENDVFLRSGNGDWHPATATFAWYRDERKECRY